MASLFAVVERANGTFIAMTGRQAQDLLPGHRVVSYHLTYAKAAAKARQLNPREPDPDPVDPRQKSLFGEEEP
jgi:hypothetical protein